MEYLTLNNGVQMPVLGLGTWDLRGEQCERVILEALEAGYRLLDTAQMYDNEQSIGRAIKSSALPREELFITTKLHHPSRSYALAKKGIEQSLRALQLDYIDLLLIHEPYPEAPAMYRALQEAYHEGKARAIGVSNFKAAVFKRLVAVCEIVPAVNQVEAHVYFGQQELQAIMAPYGTQLEAWAPFTEGRRDIFSDPTLRGIGAAHCKTSAQIALKFLVQRGIATIPKSSHRRRIRENIDIFDFTLSASEMKAIKSLDEGKSLFGWY